MSDMTETEMIDTLIAEGGRLLAERDRLRDALEKIAELDGDGLASCTPQAIMKIARAALATEEEEK